MASPPPAEKLMEQLRALQDDRQFHCLKSNDQKIWEDEVQEITDAEIKNIDHILILRLTLILCRM